MERHTQQANMCPILEAQASMLGGGRMHHIRQSLTTLLHTCAEHVHTVCTQALLCSTARFTICRFDACNAAVLPCANMQSHRGHVYRVVDVAEHQVKGVKREHHTPLSLLPPDAALEPPAAVAPAGAPAYYHNQRT